MCGVAGFMSSARAETFEKIGRTMATAIAHRGPDDAGVWADPEAGICLAHRRLAIVELSPAGAQPMLSSSGRFVLAYNGEIYNHLDVQRELVSSDPIVWRGRSDTETLLAAFERWGVEPTLERCVGMFAFALWDRRERRLVLGRDRFGEKPLYYGWVGAGVDRAFVFGSELKALVAFPGFTNPVNRDALALYTQHCTVPTPYSIYEDVFKLPPGCVLAVDSGLFARREIKVSHYWRVTDEVVRARSDPFVDPAEAVDALDEALRRSVSQQAVADVPVGAFLSGGVDSSTIVALMQAQSSRPVRTFTVGFDESGFDEADYARKVAERLGTQHEEIRVSFGDAMSLVPQLPVLYDEPFGDSSQIPTHLVCQAARRQVTVALSGDAGDELFGGYNRYFWGPRIWNWFGWLPTPLRWCVGAGIHSIPVIYWDGLGKALGGKARVSRLGDKAHRLAHRLETINGVDDLYRSLVTEWPSGSGPVSEAGRLPTYFNDTTISNAVSEAEHRMMVWDTLTYLPDDILTKVDRAAMGISLETRIPFLDHRVFRLAWRLPLRMKIRDNEGKWALRQVLYRYVPRELIERPKAGFAIPVGEWLRGPLRDWAEDLLDEGRLKSDGYFNFALIRAAWEQHLSGQYDWTTRLWSVLMFQAWLRSRG
jgi:asparagine synthase (glutamine-hydrolysing)